MCTAVIFPGEMVDYNNMFQNPGERDVGGSSRDQFLLLLLLLLPDDYVFYFLCSPSSSFFVPIFNDCCKGAHTRTKGLDTHTNFIFSSFLAYLCLSSCAFFYRLYCIYQKRYNIYLLPTTSTTTPSITRISW